MAKIQKCQSKLWKMDYVFIVDSDYWNNSSLEKYCTEYSFVINKHRFVTTQLHASDISEAASVILMTDKSSSEIEIRIPKKESLNKALNLFSTFLRPGFINEKIDFSTSECHYDIRFCIKNKDFITQYKDFAAS